jgi:hypothetical protein
MQHNHWKQGPLPKDTYNYGAIILAGADPKAGFVFADFQGDHVILQDGNNTRVEAYGVGWYNNGIVPFNAPPQA